MENLNSYFANLFLLVDLTIFSIIIYTFLTIIKDIYTLSLKFSNQKEHINDLYQGIISLKDLEALTPREFIAFCIELLEKDGYYDIEEFPSSNDINGVVCRKGTNSYFVECIDYYSLIKKRNSINTESIRRHVGFLEGNNYDCSLIITTSYISKNVESYIRELPNRYSIEIIDGDLLIKKYEFLRSLNSITINE